MPTLFIVVCLLVFIQRLQGLKDVSCNFADGQCDWHTDNGMTVPWTHSMESFWDFGTSNSGPAVNYMGLDMANQDANATGRLLSGNLTGSVNQACQLRMVYAVENHTACQLSVWLRTATNKTSLLMTLMDTYQFDKSPYISVPCTADTYQIMIEGKKMSNEPCGANYKRMGIASIEYQTFNHTTENGGMAGYGCVDNKILQPNEKGNSNYLEGDEDEPLPSVSKWAFAGIAIAVYTAFLVVCVVLYCLLRRFICRRRDPANTDKGDQVICSFSNSKLNSSSGTASALNDANPYSMPDEKHGQGQPTGSFHTPPDTASPYAVGRTASGAYEEAVKTHAPVTPLASPGGQDYSRLGQQPTFTPRPRPTVYDHANDTTGTYSKMHVASRQQDQLRDMAAAQYDHLRRNQEYI